MFFKVLFLVVLHQVLVSQVVARSAWRDDSVLTPNPKIFNMLFQNFLANLDYKLEKNLLSERDFRGLSLISDEADKFNKKPTRRPVYWYSRQGK